MRKLQITNQRVKVTAHFHEEGSVLRGDKQGSVDGFDVEVSFDLEEPDDVILEVIGLTHRMCFTESAITQAVKVNAKHIVNGEVK
ncbi:MAG: hypothetical protein OEY93_11525 [Anaerolineae bacterium]|nr:hypothetical protein [Anaerolineae bacterium]